MSNTTNQVGRRTHACQSNSKIYGLSSGSRAQEDEKVVQSNNSLFFWQLQLYKSETRFLNNPVVLMFLLFEVP